MKKTLTLILALGLACWGGQVGHLHKVSTDAGAVDALSNAQVIVQWTIPVGPATSAKIVALGGRVINEFKSLKQGVYSIPATALAALDSDATVKYVSLDRVVKKKLSTTAATINAPQVWSTGIGGLGVGVAILDSGINRDSNLGPKSNKAIVYTQDFTPSALDAKGHQTKGYGADWYGHGQHVAGIIASNGQASSCGNCTNPMIGVAPQASLINLKVLDSQGEGTDSQVIAAIDQAIALKDIYNIRVMNMSLGRGIFESYTQDPLCQAVEAAWQAGIVVVVAAGNDGRDNSANNEGYGTILAPGNDPYVITVGAMKTMGTPTRLDDLMASYSSKGPTVIDNVAKPDLVAPGNVIISLLAHNGTLPLSDPQNAVPLSLIQGGPSPAQPAKGGPAPSDLTQQPPAVNFGGGWSNDYFTLSGTSMATAVVSGAVADILQANPLLTPDQVKVLLMVTASKTFPTSSVVVDNLGNTYTDYYDMFTVGAGYLDLQAAINGMGNLPLTGNALSPSTTFDPNSGNVYVTFDPNSAWVNQTVWPERARWGAGITWSASVLSGNAVIFDMRARWGASAPAASNTLWGERARWGASSTQSSNVETSESIEVTGEN